MKAWLVKWISLDRKHEEEAVAIILSGRLGPDEVGRGMEQMYGHVTASLQEKLTYARHPASTPFRARQERMKDGRIFIHCGHNPLLSACVVTCLCVEEAEDGGEVLHYVDGEEKRSITHRAGGFAPEAL